MASLCWGAVVLAIFLSAGNTWAAVDQSWLTSITEGIKNEYALGDSFSLAVNVPQNQDPLTLQTVFKEDPADKVKQTVSEGRVYQGTRVVAAGQSGAVARVLENIQPLVNSKAGNFLVIYSEESPNVQTNTNEDTITAKINDITQNWSGFAFVFSKVADVPDKDTSQLSESFKQLGISKLGLDNIFRCYKPGDDPFECTNCSSGGDVAPLCVVNNTPSNQEPAVASTVPPGQTPPGQESGAGTGSEIATGGGEGTGGSSTGTDTATGVGAGGGGTGTNIATGVGAGGGSAGIDIATGVGAGGGSTGTGVSEGMRGRRRKKKGSRLSRRKEHGRRKRGGRHRKGGMKRRGHKGRRGGKRRRGGMRRRGRTRRRGGKRRRGGIKRRERTRRRGGKRRRGGIKRRERTRRRGGKRRRGGMKRRERTRRRGGKRRRGGIKRRERTRRRGGKRRRGGMRRRGRTRRRGGRGRGRGKSRGRGRRGGRRGFKTFISF